MGSRPFSRDSGAYREVASLLEKGKYDQLAEALESARGQHDKQHDSDRESMLMAAQHISIACSKISTAMSMHRRFYLESRQHKWELARELDRILEHAFSQQKAEDSTGEEEATVDRDFREDNHAAAIKPKNILLQAKGLIKRTLGSAQGQATPSETKYESGDVPHSVVSGKPSLAIYYLSPFQVYLDETQVKNWSNGKGKLIFKYLGTRQGQPVAKEILMELFWPGAEPQAARNNLNVAICGLRHTLSKANPEYSYVLYQDGCYLLNPELHVWVDYEHFLEHFKAARRYELLGKQKSAVREYQMAVALFQQDFLEENRYEEWAEQIRQELKNNLLTLLEQLSRLQFNQQDYESCAAACMKALQVDSCYEDFHRLLMRCYNRQGHTHLALRQYHYCKEALKRELNATPSTTTQQLYEQIRQGKEV